MSWDSSIGQERVKSLLKRVLQSKQIAHAYLFYGPEGIGKDALAIEFAKILNCSAPGEEACDECSSCKKMKILQHPNLKMIFALPVGKGEKTGDNPLDVLTENQIAEVREQIQRKSTDPYYRIEISKANTIKINSVRDIKRESSLSQVEIGKKIFLILNAEMMNAEASNSLLKILEEPLPGTILLLTTSSKDQLLPTIVSRCQLIKCDLLSEKEIEAALIARNRINPSLAHLIAQLANGSYGAACRLVTQNIQEERAEVVEFLRLVLGKQKMPLLDFIDEFISSADRLEVERWLKLLESWIRDALLLTTQSPTAFLEEDRKDLESFITKYKGADLITALQTIEQTIAHLNKNAYLYLLLMNLAIQLRNNIEQSTHA